MLPEQACVKFYMLVASVEVLLFSSYWNSKLFLHIGGSEVSLNFKYLIVVNFSARNFRSQMFNIICRIRFSKDFITDEQQIDSVLESHFSNHPS